VAALPWQQATLAANVANGLGHGLTGAAVAAWPAGERPRAWTIPRTRSPSPAAGASHSRRCPSSCHTARNRAPAERAGYTITPARKLDNLAAPPLRVAVIDCCGYSPTVEALALADRKNGDKQVPKINLALYPIQKF
jgi:hypothetical protein